MIMRRFLGTVGDVLRAQGHNRLRDSAASKRILDDITEECSSLAGTISSFIDSLKGLGKFLIADQAAV